MNCEVCKKYFTGIESFKQHEASEKHKKKMLIHNSSGSVGAFALPPNIENVNPNNFPCTVCAMTFQSLSEFTEHSGSQEHALMVLWKRNAEAKPLLVNSNPCDALSEKLKSDSNIEDCDSTSQQLNKTELPMNNYSAVTSWLPRCEKCAKNFSGPEPYQQHIDSLTHKKKCGLLPSNVLVELPLAANGPLYCKLCDVNLSGPVPYQDHMRSMRHRKKEFASSNSLGENPKDYSSNNLGENSKDSSFNSLGENSKDSSSNSLGEISKEYTNMANLMGTLKCEVCDKIFTGPSPYQQHLDSETHKKEVERKRYLKQFCSEENSGPSAELPVKLNNLSPWYCGVCDVQCSGPAPYRQHLASEKHGKKAMRGDADSKRNELQSLLSGQISSFGSSGQASKQALSRSEIDGIKGNGNAATADSGHVVKKFLYGDGWDENTCTPSSLNLTFFAVGEEINFDKNSKTKIEVGDLDMVDVKEEETEEMDE